MTLSITTADVIRVATAEIGYRETGNNDTKFNRWLGTIPGYPHGGYGYPWCHSFASWVFAQAGGGSLVPRTAGCLTGVSWFKSRGQWYNTPKVGDLVYYGPNGGTHVEIVVAVTSANITTIGGNTGGSLNGAYYNGDGVYRKTVSRNSSNIHGYGRPKFSGGGSTPTPTPPPTGGTKAPAFPLPSGYYFGPKEGPTQSVSGYYSHREDLRKWQNRMKARGWTIGADGLYGNQTRDVTRAFQAEKGLGVDGKIGPATWRAAWESPVT